MRSIRCVLECHSYEIVSSRHLPLLQSEEGDRGVQALQKGESLGNAPRPGLPVSNGHAHKLLTAHAEEGGVSAEEVGGRTASKNKTKQMTEKLTIERLAKKYSQIEDKIPGTWPTYEEAGINLAQDLSFGHWDVKDHELVRVMTLIETMVPGLRILQHADRGLF